MNFFDYIFNRNVSQKENPGRLSSYRQAAELICMCWNKLDMSFMSLIWIRTSNGAEERQIKKFMAKRIT